MYESLAILTYLERRYPRPALLPSCAKAHALSLMRMHEANNVSSASGEVRRAALALRVPGLPPLPCRGPRAVCSA